VKLQLQFFRGRRGDAISRLPSGKIVVVDRRAARVPQPGEKWECEIIEKERVAIARPLRKIVKKQRPVITVYECGHRVTDYEEVEVPEDIEPEPRVRESMLSCDECSRRLREAVESIRAEIEQKLNSDAELQRIKEEIRVIKNKERELQRFITEAWRQYTIVIRKYDARVPGSGVKGAVWKYINPKCPECGAEVEIQNREHGEIVKCRCGKEYRYVIKTEIEEGFWEKTWEQESRYLIDIQKEQEVQRKVEEVKTELQRLGEKLRELEKLRVQRQNEILRDMLRELGVTEIRTRISEGFGKIETNKGVFEFDEGMVIPPSRDPEMLKIAEVLERMVF